MYIPYTLYLSQREALATELGEWWVDADDLALETSTSMNHSTVSGSGPTLTSTPVITWGTYTSSLTTSTVVLRQQRINNESWILYVEGDEASLETGDHYQVREAATDGYFTKLFYSEERTIA